MKLQSFLKYNNFAYGEQMTGLDVVSNLFRSHEVSCLQIH